MSGYGTTLWMVFIQTRTATSLFLCFLKLSSEASDSVGTSANHFTVGWIWKLGVLNKIRHFLWRMACNSLPTQSSLA